MLKKVSVLSLAVIVLTMAAVQSASAQGRRNRNPAPAAAAAPDVIEQGGSVSPAKVVIDDGVPGSTGGTIGSSTRGTTTITSTGGSTTTITTSGGHWVYYYRVRYIGDRKVVSRIPYRKVWVENTAECGCH
ncbi:MAG: hypothetical protein LBT89_07355 [Planctomycetaceae bacterium]|jgi:hypothetical protein|nr:hypothetical protein [Planctomycetaceae bacterium]